MTPQPTFTSGQIAAHVKGTLHGAADVALTGIATLDTAGPSDLAFVEDEKKLPEALASRAGAIIAGPWAVGARSAAPLIICENPRQAFARAGAQIVPPRRPSSGIHPTAVVSVSASLGAGVTIGPHVVVEDEAVIGEGVWLDAGVHVGRGVRVGARSSIRSNSVIYPGTTIGARVIVHAGSVLGSDGFGYVRDNVTGRYEAFPQVGRLVIEDDVELGALCTIDRGALGTTTIKRGTKLDNQVHVAHNVEIGEDVVIAAQTGIAGSSVIEDKAVIAGQVGIADHVRIGGGAILGAQCGVPTGKVLRGPGVLFWGTPARPIKQCLKELATLARLAKR